MANLDLVSDNFKPITDYSYKKYKSFDCKTIRPVTFYEGRITLNQIGSYITSIRINQNDLNTNSHDFLEMVLIFCPKLEHIYINDVTLSNKMLKKMKNLFPKLKSIELICCSLDDSIGEYLETAKSLEKLNLRKNDKIIGNCISNRKNLVSLNLSRCHSITTNTFANICTNNSNLLELNIIRCQITLKTIINITTYLKNIEELSISSCYEFLSPSDLNLFANLPKLKKLKVKFHHMSHIDDLLILLAKKDLLKFLDIADVPTTNKVTEALLTFTKLEFLKMNASQNEFKNEHLVKLKIKETIKELYLLRCFSLSSASLISFIENSPNICVLNVNNCYNLTEEFYYSVLASLKEQDRKHCLTVYLNDTRIKENAICPEIIKKNLPWIEWKFLDDDLPDDDADSVQSYQPVSDVGEFLFFFVL